MPQQYSNPKRASDPHALPDVETLYVSADDFPHADEGTWQFERIARFADSEAVDFRNVTDARIDGSGSKAAAQTCRARWDDEADRER